MKIGEKSHALLGPSGASRWIACTPSARLEEQFPDSISEAAAEGTVAHALCETLLRGELGELRGVKLKRALAEIEASEYYNGAMKEHAEDYVVFVLERLAEARKLTKDAVLEVEVKLDLTRWVPESFGTSDTVIIADGVMDVIDMKYGKGVLVEATENKQMMLYALGALDKYSLFYRITTVRMTIYQPRLGNFSSYEMPTIALLDWANEYLKPRAKMAFDGEGEFVVGPHCQFCRAKAVCRAYATHQLEVDRYQLKHPDLLDETEVVDVLDRAKDLTSWVESVKAFALDGAVNHGRKWPGYKLVEGRSNRAITDEKAAVKILHELDYKDTDIYQTKLQGITHFETLLGKKRFKEKLGAYVDKPKGAPTLVPDFDKRPEISSADDAIEDFKNVVIE